MSFRLPSQHIEDLPPHEDEASVSCSSSDDEEDQTWDDWVSDSMSNRPCKSLFEEKDFSTVGAAVEHDKTVHNFDLEQLCARLGT